MTRPAAAALAALALGCASEPPPPEQFEQKGGNYAMGTVLETTLIGPDPAALETERARIFAEVERIEALVSQWRPESDIGRLNAAAGGEPVEVQSETAALLERCVELHFDTLGVFDVTVGPLVALWTRAAEVGTLPTRQEIDAARAQTGPEKIVFAGDGRVALAARSHVDLGGVAKGYALDRAREKLGPAVDAALLSFGQSSIWAVGHPSGLEGWRLLVRDLHPEREYFGMITLRDQALSTSESLGQWSEIEGRRYGHVLDPRDGQPLMRRRTALVVGPDATQAEALSKALLVMGEDEGVVLVESTRGVEGLLADADGRSWRTSGFDRVARFRPLTERPR